jgi:multidrug transporter EmrE-like cation transporter
MIRKYINADFSKELGITEKHVAITGFILAMIGYVLSFILPMCVLYFGIDIDLSFAVFSIFNISVWSVVLYDETLKANKVLVETK